VHLAELSGLEGFYVLDTISNGATDPHEGWTLPQPPPAFEGPWREVPAPGELNLVEMFSVHGITAIGEAIMAEGVCRCRCGRCANFGAIAIIV
jgi:hypothetical protein